MTTTTKPPSTPLKPTPMSRTTSTPSRAPPSPAPPLTPRLPTTRTTSSTSSASLAATRSPRPVASTRKLKEQYGSEIGTGAGRVSARVAGSTVGGTSGRASPALSSVGSTIGRDRNSGGARSSIGTTGSTVGGRTPTSTPSRNSTGSTTSSRTATPSRNSTGSTISSRTLTTSSSSSGSTVGRTPSASIGSSRTAPSSPMFFHASSTKQPPTTPTPSAQRGPRVTPSGVNLNTKFFHASQAPPRTSTPGPGPTLAPPRPSSVHPRDSASNHPLDLPSLPLATPEREPRSVRFVYANGTSADDALPPSSKQPSELSSSSSTNTFSPSEAGYGGRPSLSPHHSSLGPSAMSPPLSPPTSASRRSSIGMSAEGRNNRAVSISSINDLYERSPSTLAEMREDAGSVLSFTGSHVGSTVSGFGGGGGGGGLAGLGGLGIGGLGGGGSVVGGIGGGEKRIIPSTGLKMAPRPEAMVARPTFAQREEAAALARRERKVLDLEISNASLLAINKTLEKKMRKQLGELRRFRRLSRSGKLHTLASPPSPADDTAQTPPDDLDLDPDLHSAPSASDSSDFDSEDESSDEPAEGEQALVKDRVHDEKRLASDLKKHQALLDASKQMNLSLHRCQLVTEQLISDARKALEYKVPDSELRLGGRILREDGEDGEDDPLDGGEEDDGEERKADFHFLEESSGSDEEGSEGSEASGEDPLTGEEGEESFVASSLDGVSSEEVSSDEERY